jgi:hypothetical protein
MANDAQPPLRYPPEGKMSRFEGNHNRQNRVANIVRLAERFPIWRVDAAESEEESPISD